MNALDVLCILWGFCGLVASFVNGYYLQRAWDREDGYQKMIDQLLTDFLGEEGFAKVRDQVEREMGVKWR